MNDDNMAKKAALAAIEANREFFRRGGREPVSRRRELLKRIDRFLFEHRDKVFSALNADLHKSHCEAAATEYLPLRQALKYLMRKLPRLARTRRVPVSPLNFPARGRLYPEPYGVVLVFATWNYPLLLALEPVAGALAAGNRVVLQLPPQSQRTTQFLHWMAKECFPDGELLAFSGEIPLDDLLDEKFDYIFFTGGEELGGKVYRRAAEQLTPVTLELGGKNPCIVAPGCDLALAARRIAWGKFTNAGQTCLAPDFLLVEHDIKADFLAVLRSEIRNLYGEAPVDNPDYPWLINGKRYETLSKLSAEGRLVTGGEKNPNRFCIAPTVIDGIDCSSPLMEREIFGPILPVMEYFNEEDLKKRLTGGCSKPLALYCFGGSCKLRDELLRRTSSGAVTFDDTVMHFINPAMPFGGVGTSGIGAYHGKYTFDTFTHYKPVMYQSTLFDWPMRYPPYSKWKKSILNFLTRYQGE